MEATGSLIFPLHILYITAALYLKLALVLQLSMYNYLVLQYNNRDIGQRSFHYFLPSESLSSKLGAITQFRPTSSVKLSTRE